MIKQQKKPSKTVVKYVKEAIAELPKEFYDPGS